MPDPSLLYDQTTIRSIERAALAAHPPGTLMQRAGAASAEMALRLIREANSSDPVLILAGPGNNGGDALVAAACLLRAGVPVLVLLQADPAKQPVDAHQALQHARSNGVDMLGIDRWQECLGRRWSLIIDGLFGIGLTRPIDGATAALIHALNDVDCPLLALDVPSGLDADTGNIVGPHGVAVRASHTITFIGNKPGLHTADGADHAGQVEVAPLDLDDSFFPGATISLNGLSHFSHCLRPRKRNSHKGSFGDLTIVGGAHGMAGAAILAARAGAKAGAGRVFAAFLDTPPAYDALQPELMCRPAQLHAFSNGVLVAGPGLGTKDDAADVLARVLKTTLPLVLDADALNLLASDATLRQLLVARSAPAVMTPHPLEAARLLSTGSTNIQADRISAARRLAASFNSIVALKGAGSVLARQDGLAVINTTGNPGLATAGTGDVLAGICGALLAQGWPAWEAALASVWLHGRAADVLVQRGIGPVGLTASELIPEVRQLMNDLTAQPANRAC
ncbi:NAD(P)H-hydrate dehydratase [Noviherbaspirillum sp.]|uniref:NAD(P)H-hydrate dehydratase n=1 Tax=Noviherbaspirillum sp. TaxID=1926288 RepID=UPI002FE3CD36